MYVHKFYSGIFATNKNVIHNQKKHKQPRKLTCSCKHSSPTDIRTTTTMLWPTSLIIIPDRYEVSMFIGFEWFAIDNVCWTSSVAFGAIAIIVADSADVYSTSTVSPW